MKESKEFNTQFVAEIESYPLLYDFHHRDYNRQSLTQKTWAKIGRKFNEDPNECKSKWKIIRSSFIRSLNSTAKSEPGSKKLYYLSNHLQFLLPFLKTLDDKNEQSFSYFEAFSQENDQLPLVNKMRDSYDFCIEFTKEVEKYPALYDSSLPEHGNKNVIEPIWERIGKKLGESGHYCRTKWRLVRGSYVRSLSKPGAKEYYLAPYLQFLKPFVKVVKQQDSTEPDDDEINYYDNQDDVESEQESEPEVEIKPSFLEIEVTGTQMVSTSTSYDESTLNKAKKRTQNTTDEGLDIDSKRRKVAGGKTSDPLGLSLCGNEQGTKIEVELEEVASKDKANKNPNEMFMLSLVHYMDTMTPQQQLAFQKGIVELIERIKYPKTDDPDNQ